MTKRILIIQTAFIGDVILVTSLVESLAQCADPCEIDVLVRSGNEYLLSGNPHIRNVYDWEKREHKVLNFFKTLELIRANRYDLLLNLHRFFSSGLMSFLVHAREKRGFDKNPLSLFYSKSFKHRIHPFAEVHEIERNHLLINDLCPDKPAMPRLYLEEQDSQAIAAYGVKSYICIAPASAWFSKQLPSEKWQEFLRQVPSNYACYFLGAKSDRTICEGIITGSGHKNSLNLAGELSLKQSAALMAGAQMNYVLDSAPLHLASAVNARVTAIFCSTTTGFGFGPLSSESTVVEYADKLDCRPCGIHGKISCPEKHFLCGNGILAADMLSAFPNEK